LAKIYREYPEKFNEIIERFDKNNSYLTELKLCVGAQVMLITNLDLKAGLANGSRGIIESFREHDGIPMVLFKNKTIPIPIERYYWESDNIDE
jgi:hypothetical protein